MWRTKTSRSQDEQIIKTRWIDINKGDDDSPAMRRRFVGKDFSTGSMEGLAAGTPPFEAF